MAGNHQNILSLAGKDIWVFGGAGYLGQATVKLLAAAGARVLCVDLAGKSAAFIQSAKLDASITAADLNVNECEKIKPFVEHHIAARGIPHGLVIMTAATTAKKLEELTEQDVDQVNHGGITSTFLLAKELGAQMAAEGRGSIVLFASMYGMVSPNPDAYKAPMNKNPVEYGVTKAGLIQMARYLAVHWGRSNVRCNSISPGPFPNPNVQKDHPDFIERLSGKAPLGRIGKSEEIAGAVAFLLSDAASYITGHNLAVDGGWTAW